MTREEAQRRLDEWRMVESTGVWRDLVSGLSDLLKVHSRVVDDSLDSTKIFRSQGAKKICLALLNAKENQLREAYEVLEGKRRITEKSARV